MAGILVLPLIVFLLAVLLSEERIQQVINARLRGGCQVVVPQKVAQKSVINRWQHMLLAPRARTVLLTGHMAQYKPDVATSSATVSASREVGNAPGQGLPATTALLWALHSCNLILGFSAFEGKIHQPRPQCDRGDLMTVAAASLKHRHDHSLVVHNGPELIVTV